MNKNLVILGVIALASTYLFVSTLKQSEKPSLSAADPVIF